MRNEKLDLLIEKYRKTLELKSDISELENTKEVRTYLKAINEYNNLSFDNSTFKKDTTYHVDNGIDLIKMHPMDKIYVYMGTYKYTTEKDVEHPVRDCEVNKYDESADYSLYYNLEKNTYSPGFSIQISLQERSKFEKDNLIIFPKRTLNRERQFYNIQRYYFETSVLESKEVALKKVLIMLK